MSFSHEASVLEEEKEGAPLHWRWVDQWAIKELSVVPELKPVEIVGTDLDVVIHAGMLEEELSVAPERAELVRAGHDPADKALLATELGRLIEGEDLKHHCVHWDDFDLILEIILVFVSPSVDIIGLKLQLEWPVRLGLFMSILVILSGLHH